MLEMGTGVIQDDGPGASGRTSRKVAYMGQAERSEASSGPLAAKSSTPAGDLSTGSRPAPTQERPCRTGPLVRRIGLQLASVLVLLALWAFVAAMRWVDPLYLPGPGAVWDAFVRANSCYPITEGAARKICGESNYYLWEHLVVSLQRIGVGVGLGALAGVVVGYLMGSSRLLMLLVNPYLNFLRALPPLGYIGLLVVWVGIGESSKYWLLFLAAFPPVVIATIQGVASVREDQLLAASSLGAGLRERVMTVILPSSLPYVVQGIRLATGFAWTTVVAAELNNGIPGIGGLAFQSGVQLQTALTIACILVIGLVAVALDQVIVWIGRALVPWQGKEV